MIYSVYDSNTGKIEYLTNQAPADLPWIEGEYHPKQYYVADGQAVSIPANPSTDLCVYDFDFVTKTWQLNQDLSSSLSRQHRNYLLSQVDRVNPIWYNSLTSQQQQELADYRQALLDVPQQPGFPVDVVWAAKPTWL